MPGCLFEQTSLDSLKKGANLDGDSGIGEDTIPDWYDDEKFKRGQDFFHRHVAAIGYSMHCSLVSGFSIINLLEPLVFTNMSDTPKKAFKRYLLTFYHIYQWMSGDVWDPQTTAYQSLKTVRRMHKNVAVRMGKAFTDKKYVSQYDMGLVQSGFFGAMVMYPEEFGVHCTTDELEDYVYVWRVLGYKLGIKDEYNICTGSLSESRRIVKEIEQTCLIPALRNPPKDFEKMADAYIDGMNLPLLIKMHSKESVLAHIYQAFGYECPYKLSFADELRYLWLRFMTASMYYIPGMETVMNFFALRLYKNRKTELAKMAEDSQY